MIKTEVLPNSIPRQRKENWDLGPDWYYLYCASCNKPGGSARITDIPNHEHYAFYLCNDCAEKYGDLPPNLYLIPDEIFWQKVKEAKENGDSELSISKLIQGGK